VEPLLVPPTEDGFGGAEPLVPRRRGAHAILEHRARTTQHIVEHERCAARLGGDGAQDRRGDDR
jgi:hypothetical protein